METVFKVTLDDEFVRYFRKLENAEKYAEKHRFMISDTEVVEIENTFWIED